MAVDMFLKLTNIDGESQDSKHQKEIEILSFSWGAHQQGTHQTGTGGGAGKANVAEPTFTHFVDKASTTLWQYCVSGKHIAKAEFTARKAGAGDGKPFDYFTLKLDDVLIASVQTAGSGHGEDRMTEHFSLNFRRFEVQYNTQDNQGVKQPGQPVKWDLQKNEEV